MAWSPSHGGQARHLQTTLGSLMELAGGSPKGAAGKDPQEHVPNPHTTTVSPGVRAHTSLVGHAPAAGRGMQTPSNGFSLKNPPSHPSSSLLLAPRLGKKSIPLIKSSIDRWHVQDTLAVGENMKIKRPDGQGARGQESSEEDSAQLSVFRGLSHHEQRRFIGILRHQPHAGAQVFQSD